MNVININRHFREPPYELVRSLDDLFQSEIYQHMGDLPSVDDNPRTLRIKN